MWEGGFFFTSCFVWGGGFSRYILYSWRTGAAAVVYSSGGVRSDERPRKDGNEETKRT